jgi:MFS family permease
MLAGPADLLLLFNLTESPLLSSPAYRFNPGQVGYTNFAFFVGGIIGVATAGPFSDWLARRSTKKNNGIREAEMRLPALIPFVCFFIISHVSQTDGQKAYSKHVASTWSLISTEPTFLPP